MKSVNVRQSRLQDWSEGFNSFLSKPEIANLSARERRGIAVMKLQHSWDSIWIPTKLNTEETQFDAHFQDFEQGLEIVEFIESMDRSTFPKDDQHVNFSFMLQRFTTFYLTAIKCRNTSLRRRALFSSKGSPKRKRFWYSSVVVKIVERVIELEEEGLE